MCTSENMLGIEVAYLFELKFVVHDVPECIVQLLSFNGSLGY